LNQPEAHLIFLGENMRICHLTSVHPYTDVRIFHKECSSLAAAGYEVHFVAPGAPDKIINGVRLHGVICNNRSRFYRATENVWSVYRKALAINADVYHLHDPELLIIGLLLKEKNKKVIYDAHEDFPRTLLTKYWIPKGTRQLMSWLSDKVENMISKHLQLVVTATPHILERFMKLGCNAVNINNYPINGELSSLRVDWKAKQPSVCHCGLINDHRGIFEMITALEKTNIKLLLAGKFESKFLRDRAMAMKGWKNVRELGQLDRNGVKLVLQESMGGLTLLHPTPNHIYALPNKMFEYMASAIPVIGSNFPLWQEIINNNKCGICVDPLNPNEIANAINWIVGNPEEARIMGENGRIAVTEKYNWRNENKKLVQFYQNI
jgi:glycosyltransferase involved in cell wall biosynthesis